MAKVKKSTSSKKSEVVVTMNPIMLKSVVTEAETNGIQTALDTYIYNNALVTELEGMVDTLNGVTQNELVAMGVPPTRTQAIEDRSKKLAVMLFKFRSNITGTMRKSVRFQIGKNSTVLRKASKRERLLAQQKKIAEALAELDAEE